MTSTYEENFRCRATTGVYVEPLMPNSGYSIQRTVLKGDCSDCHHKMSQSRAPLPLHTTCVDFRMLRAATFAAVFGVACGVSIDSNGGSVTVSVDQAGSLYVQPVGGAAESVALARDITALTNQVTSTNSAVSQVSGHRAALRVPSSPCCALICVGGPCCPTHACLVGR